MKAKLRVLHGPHAGMEFEIPTPQCLVGRDPDCYVRPKSEAVSRHHCVLYVQDGKLFVRDLHSRSGTFVNDQPVQPEGELHHGDELRVGPTVFEVHVLRPTDDPKTRAIVSEKAEHVAPRQACRRPPEDGMEGGDETANRANSTTEDNIVKVPGSWSKKPTAASTHDAAEEALRSLFRGR